MEMSHPSALDLFSEAVGRGPDNPAIHYFDLTLSYGEVEQASNDFAVALAAHGFKAGDRLVLLLQNIPHFVIGVLGTWKAGGIVVPLNVMYTPSEVRERLIDSGATVLLCLESALSALARGGALDVGGPILAVTAPDGMDGISPDLAEGVGTGDPQLSDGEAEERYSRPERLSWDEFLPRARMHEWPSGGGALREHPATAMLCYTSGTTGPAKAAMNTHANVIASASLWKKFMSLGPDDVILAIAPLFHITGFMGHMISAFAAGAPIVLFYRFEAARALQMTARWEATFTVAPITAFISLLESPEFSASRLRSLGKIVSGGAPVPPAVVERFEREAGHYIYNAYGLTESTSLCIGAPLGRRAPVDQEFHALSVGMAVANTEVRIVDPIDGSAVADGSPGEILIRGPQVVAGYWGRTEETSHAIRDGWLHTGDVGRKDALGWIYVIDRMKDLIIASGYKIWPREVEDILHSHEAVREAAVVGIPDEYRGETVKAFVSLRSPVSTDELIQYCKDRLAAYKYPRVVEVLDEIPKTATGKYLRRRLKESGS
jgi:long-chain acyl-CoA synthetase